MTGGVTSTTDTVKLHFPTRPAAFVALHKIVVDPNAKSDPEALLHTAVGVGPNCTLTGIV